MFSLDDINWGQQGLMQQRSMMVRLLQAYPEEQGGGGGGSGGGHDHGHQQQRVPGSTGFNSPPKWKPGTRQRCHDGPCTKSSSFCCDVVCCAVLCYAVMW